MQYSGAGQQGPRKDTDSCPKKKHDMTTHHNALHNQSTLQIKNKSHQLFTETCNGAIVRRYLRYPTFSRFDTILECDRQTDRQTERQTHRHTTTAYTTLSIALCGKNMKGLAGGLC